MTKKKEWWRGGTIYQIYPRSFMDSNGDGVGDLKGITEKLPYIANLGIDAVWLSPFFTSPMKDYGYDVADYRDVDPLFGTLDDFRTLLDTAHGLNLKIIIDMVLSHTSDQHPWFQESQQSRNNDKAEWYVWADPKPDGSPPNNWQAHFGGPSWTYDVRRGQYYLHNFLKEQPDLNLHNENVKKTLFEMMRFWLDMGVDGFRLDALGCYFHSPLLEDNPPNPNPAPSFFNIAFPTPHSMQIHQHDYLIEPGIKFCEEIRALLDEYSDRMAVAEVGGEDCVTRAVLYTDGPARLHTSYNFGLLGANGTPAHIRAVIEEFQKQPGTAWPSWALSNHDVVRVASRWHPDRNGYHHDPRLSKMLIALLGSLRGTLFLYQGEELGLPEAAIPPEQIQDPWGQYLYPLWQGRDGCRTPMPWEPSAPHAGFSKSAPWLPIPDEHQALCVATQERDPQSLLHFTRRLLRWRQENNVMLYGDLSFFGAGNEDCLAFIRNLENEKILCLFNFSNQTQKIKISETTLQDSLFNDEELGGNLNDDGVIELPPYGFLFSAIV